MRKKLVAALAAGGVLAGGATATAVFAATPGAQAAPATAAAAAVTPLAYCQGPLAGLVAQGTITRAQATAISAAMISYMRDHRVGFTPSAMRQAMRPGGPLRTVLSQLVKNGTITQTQATAISDAMTRRAQEHWGNGTGPDGRGPGMMGGGMMGGGRTGQMWAGNSAS